MFETAIIGTGAAGISAALTLKALNKDFIWFGSTKLSEKIMKAEKIRNYPGLPMTSGEGMQKVFLEQVAQMGIEITDKTVTGVYDMGDYYGILCNQDMFEAKTIILATGVESVKPIKGELEFVGRGVSYCATCDGFLYQDKTIGILCTSKELEHEIKYLSSLAKKVYLMPIYQNVEIEGDNIEIIKGMPLEIVGTKKAEKLIMKSGEIDVDGIFMLKSAVTPSVLVSGIEVDGGHIVVDRAMKTNLRGVYAAGDCTGRPYQYAKAVGEGNVAAHSVNDYLAK